MEEKQHFEETLLKEALSLRKGKSEEEKKTITEMIYFRLGKEYYAIRLKEAREISSRLPVYPVPGTESHILGVTNIRGEIIPVIDLKLRLDLGKTDLNESFYIIVIKAFEEPLAMAVDVVEDIVEVSEILPCDKGLLKGKIQIKEKVIGILDLKRVFYPDEE